MDVSIWHGVLLLSGAVGANLIIDRDPAEEEGDTLPPSAPVSHAAPHPGQAGADIAVHRDTLAWFLNADEGPGDLPATPPEAAAPHAAASGDQIIALDEAASPPVIEGFSPGAHQLELVYTPAIDPATGAALQPSLSIQPNQNGSGSVIMLDGAAVAELPGITDLLPEDITLVPDQPQAEAKVPPPPAAEQAAA